jgi:hypothetical protein
MMQNLINEARQAILLEAFQPGMRGKPGKSGTEATELNIQLSKDGKTVEVWELDQIAEFDPHYDEMRWGKMGDHLTKFPNIEAALKKLGRWEREVKKLWPEAIKDNDAVFIGPSIYDDDPRVRVDITGRHDSRNW